MSSLAGVPHYFGVVLWFCFWLRLIENEDEDGDDNNSKDE